MHTMFVRRLAPSLVIAFVASADVVTFDDLPVPTINYTYVRASP